MSDVPHWTDIVVAVAAIFAFAISLASAVIAWTARKDSKKSADVAENSAHEAKAARKIAQAAMLVELFAKMEYLFESPLHSKVPLDNKKFQEGKEAARKLKDILSGDKELVSVLDDFCEGFTFYSFETWKNLYRFRHDPPLPPDSNTAQQKLILEKKKHEYLNIG
jgi:hypothetical protein